MLDALLFQFLSLGYLATVGVAYCLTSVRKWLTVTHYSTDSRGALRICFHVVVYTVLRLAKL